MGAVDEILARRSVKRGVSATPNRLGASQSHTTTQSQIQATESTPRSSRIVSSSTSSPLHHQQQQYSPLSTKVPESHEERHSTQFVTSSSSSSIQKKVIKSQSPAILPLQSSIEDEVRSIILSLRPVIQTEPLHSIKESSTLLLKRFFARFGEGSPRFVPFFRFQDLCLQLIGHTALSHAQINAVFVLANTLEFSTKSELATTLEDSLDFITFSNTKQEEMINIMLKFPPITNILILKKLPINKAESITRELKQKNYRFIQILEHSVINRFLNMIDNK
jgi:hypothetical protein